MKEVYFDGASAGNPGPSGAGVYIKCGGEGERFSIPLGSMSNHEAEYHALLEALRICLAKGYKAVSFRTDSELVNRAVEKEYVRSPLYAPLLREALALAASFDLFFLKWIPSKENRMADELGQGRHSKE
ncbi:reverse transcriptase-like protein [Paenibacillus sp. CC-CFT747]|nr:reverse transcriptase-like protein [Paenibacillus sp. CC-CFT747]